MTRFLLPHPILLLFALVLAAGCSSPSSPQDVLPVTPTPEPEADLVPPTYTEWKEGQLDAGLGVSTPAATCWAEMGADRILEFSVPQGTLVLVLELAWDDDFQDLTMVARSPRDPSDPCSPARGDTDGFTGSPDNPARLVVTDPQPGSWTLGAQANGVVSQTIQYTLYATTSSIPLEDSFSAIPAA